MTVNSFLHSLKYSSTRLDATRALKIFWNDTQNAYYISGETGAISTLHSDTLFVNEAINSASEAYDLIYSSSKSYTNDGNKVIETGANFGVNVFSSFNYQYADADNGTPDLNALMAFAYTSGSDSSYLSVLTGLSDTSVFDANNSGSLDLNELMAMYDSVDKDKDGIITVDERYQAYSQDLTNATVVANIKASVNNFITENNLSNLGTNATTTMDLNNDGSVSQDELLQYIDYRNNPGANTAYNSATKDSSGNISIENFGNISINGTALKNATDSSGNQIFSETFTIEDLFNYLNTETVESNKTLSKAEMLTTDIFSLSANGTISINAEQINKIKNQFAFNTAIDKFNAAVNKLTTEEKAAITKYNSAVSDYSKALSTSQKQTANAAVLNYTQSTIDFNNAQTNYFSATSGYNDMLAGINNEDVKTAIENYISNPNNQEFKAALDNCNLSNTRLTTINNYANLKTTYESAKTNLNNSLNSLTNLDVMKDQKATITNYITASNNYSELINSTNSQATADTLNNHVEATIAYNDALDEINNADPDAIANYNLAINNGDEAAAEAALNNLPDNLKTVVKNQTSAKKAYNELELTNEQKNTVQTYIDASSAYDINNFSSAQKAVSNLVSAASSPNLNTYKSIAADYNTSVENYNKTNEGSLSGVTNIKSVIATIDLEAANKVKIKNKDAITLFSDIDVSNHKYLGDKLEKLKSKDKAKLSLLDQMQDILKESKEFWSKETIWIG